MANYLAGASGSGRVLIPGCGAAHEVATFHEAGYEVIAIDFSPAAVAAAILIGLGFEQVSNLKGGMLDWNDQNLPVERGTPTS